MSDCCTCAKPKPTEASMDEWQTLLGVEIWTGGSDWLACESCGKDLTPPIPATTEER